MTRDEWEAICGGDDQLVPSDDPMWAKLAEQSERDRRALIALVREIAEKAGRVKCKTCDGKGDRLWSLNSAPGYYYTPCPDCAPLRELLEVVR